MAKTPKVNGVKANKQGVKSKKKASKKALRKAFLQQNEYAQALANPFTTRGVRIPDRASFPTSTFSAVQRLQVTVPTGGFWATRWEATPYFFLTEIDNNPSTRDTFSGGNQGLWYSAFSNGANDLFGEGDPTGQMTLNGNAFNILQGMGYFAPMPFSEDISNVMSSGRVVSAGLLAEYTGTALNNSGVFTACFLPAEKVYEEYFVVDDNGSTVIGNGAYNLQTLQSEYDSATRPANSGSIALTYHPLSESAYSFGDTYAQVEMSVTETALSEKAPSTSRKQVTSGDPLLTSTLPAQFMPMPQPYLARGGEYDDGAGGVINITPVGFSVAQVPRTSYNHQLVIAGSGFASGSTIQVTLVVNFEGVPYTNQLTFADSSPSPVDTLKLDHALSVVPGPLIGGGSEMVSNDITKGGGAVDNLVSPAVGAGPPRVQQSPTMASEKIPSGGTTAAKSGKHFMDFLVDDVVPYVAKYGPMVASAIGALL